MIDYLMKYKQRVAVAVVAVLAAVIAVLHAVPGDQSESTLQGVHDQVKPLVDQIPNDVVE